MQKYLQLTLLSVSLLAFVSAQTTKSQVITLENYEGTLNQCLQKVQNSCEGATKLRKQKNYIFVDNKDKFQHYDEHFMNFNFQQAPTPVNNTRNCTNTTTPCNNSTNTTIPNSPKNSTNTTIPTNPKNQTLPTNSTNTTIPVPPKNTTLPNNSTNTTIPVPPKNTTLPQNSTNTTAPTVPKKNEIPNNSTNTTKPTFPTNTTNNQGCKQVKDIYIQCIISSYDLGLYSKSSFYDAGFQGYAKYLAGASQNCENQALSQQNSQAGKKLLDQFNTCYANMVGVSTIPTPEQNISEFNRYSNGCKQKYASTCDQTCLASYTKFEQCVQTCEPTIKVTTGYDISGQVRNHMTQCVKQCNLSTKISSDKKAGVVFKCIADNQSLVDSSKISSYLLNFFALISLLFFL